MKLKSIFAPVIMTALACCLITSCGPDANVETLKAQTENLASELDQIVASSDGFVKSATASYGEEGLTVDVAFGDTLVNTKLVSPALFNFFTAIELKSHADKNLEATVNALSAKDQPLIVNATDYKGDKATYSLTPSQLKHLYKTPLTQLEFSAVKNNVSDILASFADRFITAGATGASFDFSGGYGNYTVTFPTKKDFITKNNVKDLNIQNLKARAINTLKSIYGGIGSFAEPLAVMNKSVGLDGFHLIYVTEKGDDTMKVTVLWRDIL